MEEVKNVKNKERKNDEMTRGILTNAETVWDMKRMTGIQKEGERETEKDYKQKQQKQKNDH